MVSGDHVPVAATLLTWLPSIIGLLSSYMDVEERKSGQISPRIIPLDETNIINNLQITSPEIVTSKNKSHN